IFPPNKTGEIRNDNVGQGYFGAPRSNGHGYHRGVDYLSKLGDPVIAPVSGIVERITRPYKDPVKNKHLQGIVIKNSVSRDFETVVFYVDPNKSLKKGSVVIAGQTELGKAQSMMFIHNGAKDHIHVEIHGPNNIVVPPAPNTTVK
ncbi:MAG: peptidoglycan DD-metalloendopeptidase family protein, partial [Chromatiaceae bacterium]|nr:peptidoglycan DD-metalloendopeptidase family protein [Chromatiaceae bacterium]